MSLHRAIAAAALILGAGAAVSESTTPAETRRVAADIAAGRDRTTAVALATGRADGLAVMIGLVLGIIGFNTAFDAWRPLYDSTPLGAVTLSDVVRLPAGVVVALVTGLAVLMFVAAERLIGRGRQS